MPKIIQITDTNNNIHGLDSDGNLWYLVIKDQTTMERGWAFLCDAALVKPPTNLRKRTLKHSLTVNKNNL